MEKELELLEDICDVVQITIATGEGFTKTHDRHSLWRFPSGSYRSKKVTYGIYCLVKNNGIEVELTKDRLSDVCPAAIAEIKKQLIRRIEDSTNDTQSAQTLLDLTKG
jgi:hypothetical protein